MKKRFVLLLLIVSLFAVNSSHAAFSIQASAVPGTFEISFVTDTSTSVNGYTLGFGYDTTELEFVSYTNTPFLTMTPGEFMALPVTEPTEGVLINFNAFAFGGPVLVSGTTTLGTLTFTILDGAEQDGSDDLYWGNDSLFAYGIDGTNYSNASRNLADGLSLGAGLDVGAVPIPSAIFLLGGGICALLGIKRRKNKA